MNIQLNFSVESVDYLLTLLAKLPIVEAQGMWSQIKQTAEAQIAAQQATQTTEEPVEVLEGEIVE
jgi:predicted secreted hydrolase